MMNVTIPRVFRIAVLLGGFILTRKINVIIHRRYLTNAHIVNITIAIRPFKFQALTSDDFKKLYVPAKSS